MIVYPPDRPLCCFVCRDKPILAGGQPTLYACADFRFRGKAYEGTKLIASLEEMDEAQKGFIAQYESIVPVEERLPYALTR